MSRVLWMVFALCLWGSGSGRTEGITPRNFILAGDFDGTIESVEFVNDLVGARIFYDAGYFGQRVVIANVEAGHIWSGHEVFDRSGLGLSEAPERLVHATLDGETAPQLGEVDFHATMVGHILAGTGHVGGGNLSLIGAGMAPMARLWSGAIATEFHQSDLGAFSITRTSFLVPYLDFFKGGTAGRADVINSSWGYADPAGSLEETRILDGLARQNPTVTLVAAAGNGGASAAVGGPGAGYNAITVGALGGGSDLRPFLRPSEFTSAAPGDFWNPVTGVTLPGVRAAVDLAAPAEQVALAYYPGDTGSRPGLTEPADPLPNDLYFVFNQAGTSFAAPIVAGGVALLKDVASGGYYLVGQEEAKDSRVIKAVLMAGAEKTEGWNNGQVVENGVVRTRQALDYATGAGRMDLMRSTEIYLFGTTDVPGLSGGEIAWMGWDFGVVPRGGFTDYVFASHFPQGIELTVSLNWFVNRTYDDIAEAAADLGFADLNLQIWTVSGGFQTLVAESSSRYTNGEFLRFLLPSEGLYGVRVTYDEAVYDVFGDLDEEKFALAWAAVAVPEPASVALILVFGAFCLWQRRRQFADFAFAKWR